MGRISLTELLVSIVTENQQTLAAFREVESAKERMLSSGDKAGLQTTLDKLGASAVTVNKQLDPLVRTSRDLQEEFRDLGTFVKAGLIPLSDAVRRYKELETAEKSLLASQQKGSTAWKDTAARMKEAGAEANRLEGFLRQSNQQFDAPELVRYVQRLRDVTTAEKAGLITRSQAIADLKKQEAAIQSLIGVYNKDEQAQRGLIKTLGDTGTAIRKLEADGERIEKAFRADYLKAYEGELRLIDQRVSQIGFDAAAREVEELTRDLKDQGTQLVKNGTEFNNLQKVLSTAASQQEKYQRAAEAANRANDVVQLRTYGNELKDAEAKIEKTATALGHLDAQQRAIRYDATGVRAYREENEKLGTSLGGIGGDLNELQGRLTAYQGTLTKGTTAYRETETLLDRVGKATQNLASQQEKAAAAYRAADLSRFTQELRDVETAQKAGIISAEAALRATENIQTEFRDYAASLGVTTKELKTYGDEQARAGKSALDLAAAAEKAQKAFDVKALSGFRGELEQVVKSLQSGDGNFDKLAGTVQDLQGRMKEYGTTLDGTGREQDALNKIVDASDRTLEALASSAEKAQKAFDGNEVRDFADDLDKVDAAGADLDDNFDRIAGSLQDLDRELTDVGKEADLTAKDLGTLADIEKELEAAATKLGAANDKAMASFKGDQLRTFKTELDQIVTAQKNGTLSFEQAGTAITQLQSRMKEYGTSTDLTARQQDTLQKAMGSTETAARNLEKAFVAENVTRYETQLRGLQTVFEQTRNIDAFREGIERLNTEIESSRASTEKGSTAYLSYTKSLDRVTTSLAQAEGKTRIFSTSGAVAAGIGDQLSTIFYSLGPAGEAMATAMFSATGGMEAAAGGAKLLNVALSVGLVGAVVAAGVGMVSVVKQAFTLNTGLTDVAKTTGFTKSELSELATELQKIALATGTPVKELTGLASVAGSLGVTGVKNVAQFTDVLNKLSVATDIVGDAGAEQLAKFINVTKEAGDTVGESANIVGNIIVRLGNDLAATEAPILTLAQRLGGLATTADLSQQDILALSGTYVSLGFTAEGASTSVIKVINTIAQAGKTGGPALEALAKGAGMTREEFAALSQSSPAEAFQAYIKGLKEARDAGVNIQPIIKGITKDNTAMMDVITRAVGGFDTLTLAFDSAADEGGKLTAMNNELATRLDSLQGRWDKFVQAIVFMRDKFALMLVPAIGETITFFDDMTRALFDLDEGNAKVVNSASVLGDSIQAIISPFVFLREKLGDVYEFTDKVSLVGFVTQQLNAARGIDTTSDALDKFGDKARDAGPSFDTIRDAADKALQKVGNAGDKKTLVGALEELGKTLKGDAKTQAKALADEVKDTGTSFETAATKVRKFAESVDLTAQLEQVRARLKELAAERTEIKLEFDKTFGPQLEQVKANVRDLPGASAPIEIGFKEVGGQQVVAVLNDVTFSGDEAAESQRFLDEQLTIINKSFVTNSDRAAVLAGNLQGNADETDRLTTRSKNLTQQLDALGKKQGQVAGESIKLGSAIDEYNRAYDQAINVTKMSEQNLVTYIARLQAVKAEYPELKGNIDEWLKTAQNQLVVVREQNKANTDNADTLVDLAAQEEAAADAARKREEALETVNEATELLGRGTGVTSEALFQMAQDLGEASQQSGDLGEKARALQTQLVLQAAAMDKTAAANEKAAEAAERHQERVDILREAQEGLADTERLTADEALNLAESLDEITGGAGTVAEQAKKTQAALETMATRLTFKEANDQIDQLAMNARLTGDASTLAADKADVWREVMLNLAARLGENNARTQEAKRLYEAYAAEAARVAAEQERLAEAAEAYNERLGTLREAQEALNTGTVKTAEQAREMAAGLDEAAKGTGNLGKEAQAAQDKLLALADRLDDAAEASERYHTNLDTVREAQAALQTGSDLSAEAAREMAAGLDEAAEGSGRLGSEARAAQAELLHHADAMDNAAAAADSLSVAQEVAGDAVLDAAAGYDAAGNALNTYEAIMKGLDAANRSAAETFAYTGDEVAYLEAQIGNNERAIDALTKKYGPNSQAVRELQEENKRLNVELENAEKLADANAQAQADLNGEVKKTAVEWQNQANELIKAAGGYKNMTPEIAKTVEELKKAASQALGMELLGKAVYGVAGFVTMLGDNLSNSGTSEKLEELKTKRDELLQGGEYNPEALDALNADIDALQEKLDSEQLWAGLLQAGGEALGTFQHMFEETGNVVVSVIAGIGSAFTGMASEIAGGSDMLEAELTAVGNVITSTAQGFASGGIIGGALGFFGGLIGGIIDLFSAQAEEAARVEDAVTKYGAAALEAAGVLTFTARGLELNEEKLAEYEQGLKDAAEEERLAKERAQDLYKAWQENQQQLAEYRQELNETTAAMRENNNAATEGARDARLKYAEVSGGATEAQLLIAETILGLQDASKDFNDKWAAFQDDYNKTITDFLNAHPGSSMAEARAYAESLLGPRRDALSEEFAYTSATILAEAGKQAKDLGLSQEQFYTAVLLGQTELLGDMTEGQRQALLQVIQAMRDAGIELPPALEAAFANVDQAQVDAANESAKANAEAAKVRVAAIEQEQKDITAAWDTRRTYLEDKINSTSGDEQAMYIDMLQKETGIYQAEMDKRNQEIDQINQESATVDVESLQRRRDALKQAYDAQMAEITKALETATGAERDALLKRQADLTTAYLDSDRAIADTIHEQEDGIGSALESQAQSTVTSIEEDIRATNEAWAKRSADLKNLIANSTGETKAAYEQMYADESAAYESSMSQLQSDLVSANQALLDAQDKSSDDFVAAQAEVGRKEQEALGGVFEILRQVLGPDAEVIISMIQNTYNKRRQAYLSEGQATADAAANANQSELDALAGVFETLRALLGPDAEVIISMIQGTYDKRQAAYQQGSSGAAQAAADAGAAEAQSITNITDLLYSMFGPEAQGIIDQINQMYEARANAYGTGGANAGAAAGAAAETEAQSIQNINDLLYSLFGPEAQGIIDQINAMYEGRQAAYEGGTGSVSDAIYDSGVIESDAVNSSTEQVGGALEEKQYTLEDLLARGDLTPALREAGERLDAALREGGNLTAEEIAANRDKISDAINERGTKIQALVEQGIPLDEAVRRVDEELAATWDTTAGLIEGSIEGNTETVTASMTDRNARIGELTAQGVPLADAQRQVDDELGTAFLQGGQAISSNMLASVSGIASGFLARQTTINAGQIKDAALSATEQLNQDKLSAVFGEFGPRVTTGLLAGANSAAQGFFARQNAITLAQGKDVALEAAERANQARLGSTFGDFGPLVGGAIQAGTGQTVDAINAREQLLGGSFSSTFNSLSGIYGAGTKDLTAAITGTGAQLSGSLSTTLLGVGNTFNQGATTVSSVVGSGFDRVRGQYLTATGGLVSSIQGSYQSVTNAQTVGSSGYVQKIQQAASAEQASYQAASAALLQKIAGSKGAERERLVAEYNQMQAEHAARSRAYQSEVADAARQEVSSIDGAARVVVGSLDGFGLDAVQSTKEAYVDFTREQQQGAADAAREAANAGRDVDSAIDAAQRVISGGFGDFGSKVSTDARSAYEKFINEQEQKARDAANEARQGSDDIKAAIVGGGTTIGGGFTSALSAVLPKLNSYFSGQGDAFVSKTGSLVTDINNSRTKLSTALTDYSNLIKNFKFPDLPTPPKAPSKTSFAGYDPDFGESFSYTAPANDLAVLAADATGMLRPSLPDFHKARRDVVAYAAATDDLLRLYGRSGSLRLNSVQETAFTVNLTFASLTNALSGPFAMLERTANLFYSGARISYEAALLQLEAAQTRGGGDSGRVSMLDLTTRPGRKR